MFNRRDFLKATGAAALLTSSGSVFAGSGDASSQPNIILIMTDDQGYGDLACHGNKYLKTPNLDALREESLRFTDFHVSPTCAPTRTSIMTGRHEFKSGVTHTIHERERMALSSVTLPETLVKAGYETGIFGKWHLGDEDPYQPHSRGFTEVFIHGAGGIGQSYPGTCGDAPPNRENKYYDCVIRHNKKFVQTKGYCTDVFFNHALRWIKSRKAKPFFAYIPTNAPHSPFIVPEKYSKPYKDAGLKGSVPGFYGMITNIDENVGKLVKKIDEWGLSENTLLIFMTDNGSSAGWRTYNAGMKNGKGSPNEGGTRVPAFFRWPGKIEGGVDVDALSAHVDLFPTFAELCGAKVPSKVKFDGRSLMPMLKNPKAKMDDRYVFVHKGRWKKGKVEEHKFKGCAVRNQRFRLIDNNQLYDIQNDPGEKVNVIDKHPKVVVEMRKAYEQWWKEAKAGMVNEDVPVPSENTFKVLYEKQLKEKGIPDYE